LAKGFTCWGIRLAGDERILGSSKFIEIPPKAGVKLADSTKCPKITSARALVGYIATRELSISGSELAVD